MQDWNRCTEILESTFGALLQFQYHSCEVIVYFSRDFSTTFIQYIQHTEVTANQLKSNWCFHCARLKSMYWNSVSTVGALLQFQYHCCEEIVYFSRDFSTTFIQYIQHTEVTANQLKSTPMLSLCKTLIDVLKFSIHFWGTSFSTTVLNRWSTFQLDFSTTHSIYPTYRSHGEPSEVKPMLSLCKTEIDVLKFSIHFWGTSSISVPLLSLFKGY